MKAIRNFTKTDWALAIITILLVASGVGNILLGIQVGVIEVEAPEVERLVFGTMEGPADLDPQDAWDSASFDVIENTLEGLFMYNLSDPDLPITPTLAADFGTWSGNNYTVDIRPGVKFHDGSSLTAADVVWTFDRLSNLMDYHLAKAGELYEFFDPDAGVTKRIINKTVAEDSDTVTFVLNTPYGPFEALMCFGASYILPSEGQIPFNSTLNTATDDLVGTGPFDYISYEPDVEVKFKAFKDYWRGAPQIDELIFSVINDPDARNVALLSGDIDILLDPDSDLFPTFNVSTVVELVEVGQGLGVQYLGMNNNKIPLNVRKAISYGLNYTYIIDELLDGYAVRLKSPVPEGIVYANWSNEVPVLNITEARLAMQAEYPGAPADLYDDAAWSSATLATYNYTYNIGNDMREDMLLLLQNDMDKIGIDITDGGTTWKEFIYTLYEIGDRTRDMVNLYWLGWIPDYNDASNFLNPLFTNRSIASNGAQVNDWKVQQWMEEALIETDPAVRQSLYNKIQKRLVEEVFPWCWGYVGINYDAWHPTVKGFPSNSMGRAYFYPCYYEEA